MLKIILRKAIFFQCFISFSRFNLTYDSGTGLWAKSNTEFKRDEDSDIRYAYWMAALFHVSYTLSNPCTKTMFRRYGSTSFRNETVLKHRVNTKKSKRQKKKTLQSKTERKGFAPLFSPERNCSVSSSETFRNVPEPM